MDVDWVIALMCVVIACLSLAKYLYVLAWREEEKEKERAKEELIAENNRRQRQTDLQRRYWDACVAPHKYEPPPPTLDSIRKAGPEEFEREWGRVNPYLYSEKIWPDDELWPEKTKEA